MLSTHTIPFPYNLNLTCMKQQFLTYDTEFFLFLAVLENSSCPWAEKAHMRR